MFAACHRILIAITLLLFAAIPAFHGQERPPSPSQPPPASPAKPKPRDLLKMTAQQRHLYMSAQRGAEWLQRANKQDGRFVFGFVPALRIPMEEDSYLGQVEATFALARSAKFFGNAQAVAIARHALLTLLLETTADPRQPKVCWTSPPSVLVNRAAAAGLLVLAIHELPEPASDVLDKADHLCNFLAGLLQTDGSIMLADPGSQPAADAIEQFSGPALHGLIRSQTLRPAAWKIEALSKARAYYHGYWLKKKNLPMVPEHTAAFAEAFLLTRDRDFAEFIFVMNDWLCTLQYREVDPRRQAWAGGFMPWVDGKPAPHAPDIRSALAAQSLADACRVAQAAEDWPRFKRYKEALEGCLQFLTTLQYTDANTQHFAEWYRPLLVGGFYVSARDGNLRLDHTAHCVSAFVQYLRHTAELP